MHISYKIIYKVKNDISIILIVVQYKAHTSLRFILGEYIPLPLHFSCFASYLHVVDGIAQSQTFEYRFGRYLPVLFAQAHNVLQGVLTASQIYS